MIRNNTENDKKNILDLDNLYIDGALKTGFDVEFDTNIVKSNNTVALAGNDYSITDTDVEKIHIPDRILTINDNAVVVGKTVTFNANDSSETPETTTQVVPFYRAAKKDGKYSVVKKAVTSKSTYTVTNKKTVKGKRYYYKARAYKVIDGKTYYGKMSSVKSIKAK